MTFDPIVPLQVMTYLDQIYRKFFLVQLWTNVYVTCIHWIESIVSDCFSKILAFCLQKRLKSIGRERVKKSMFNIHFT
jgi:hypothetical protein